jgi:hypothetical protein
VTRSMRVVCRKPSDGLQIAYAAQLPLEQLDLPTSDVTKRRTRIRLVRLHARSGLNLRHFQIFSTVHVQFQPEPERTSPALSRCQDFALLEDTATRVDQEKYVAFESSTRKASGPRVSLHRRLGKMIGQQRLRIYASPRRIGTNRVGRKQQQGTTTSVILTATRRLICTAGEAQCVRCAYEHRYLPTNRITTLRSLAQKPRSALHLQLFIHPLPVPSNDDPVSEVFTTHPPSRCPRTRPDITLGFRRESMSRSVPRCRDWQRFVRHWESCRDSESCPPRPRHSTQNQEVARLLISTGVRAKHVGRGQSPRSITTRSIPFRCGGALGKRFTLMRPERKDLKPRAIRSSTTRPVC